MSASEVYKVNAKDRFGPIWKFTKLTPMALLLAGCGDSAEQVREANAVSDAIPAGIYSNVRMYEETGDLGGYELKLPRGSESDVVEFVHCEGWCNEVLTAPVRRGLNGIFFEIDDGCRKVPVALERSADGVTINVDWGLGLVSRPLAKVDREWGLQVARDWESSANGPPAVSAARC